jgi:hypothetical protein
MLRKDFASLMQHPHTVKYILPSMLADLRAEPHFAPETVAIHKAFGEHKWAKRMQAGIKPAIPSYEEPQS